LINPLHALSYLYQYFKEGTIDQNIDRELSALPHRFSITDEPPVGQLFDFLIYMLIKVSGNREIARRYGEVIRQRLETIHPSQTFDVNFTSLIYAMYLLECDELVKAASLADKISSVSPSPSN